MKNWINELKQARDEARIELARLDLNTIIGMQRAGELMLAIGEINTSIIAAQEQLINELTEKKAA